MPDTLISVGTISHLIGAVLYLFLSLLLLAVWRGKPLASLLLLASTLSFVWFASLGYQSSYQSIPYKYLQALELLRNVAWYSFLLHILGKAYADEERGVSRLRLVRISLYGLSGLLFFYIIFESSIQALDWTFTPGTRAVLIGYVLLALGGLVLIEWLYRNTRPEQRWSIKFLCLALGGIFSYDFYLYSDALLFRHVNLDLWNARGAINGLTVPLLAISVARNKEWSVKLFVSRHVVFHTTTFMGAGIYLLLMSSAGYYIKKYGGEWGQVLQAVFLFGALLLLLGLLFSGRIRQRLKIFLHKHFFANKYEYGQEWLRFTETLSKPETNEPIAENIIRAIAQIVESPGGVLWMSRESGDYMAVANWSMNVPDTASIPSNTEFIQFLEKREWVIYLEEYRRDIDAYNGLELPAWLLEMERAMLILPLMQNQQLMGFIVLASPTDKTADFNWEDSDLLKTVGRQAASYLAILNLSGRLAEAKQFEAFNRLSAYVVHDLKNVVAQLSLVVRNAQRHKHNEEFMEDAMLTVENAVNKMNRMLGQLRKGQHEAGNIRRVMLNPLIERVTERCKASKPVPELTFSTTDCYVAIDGERFEAVLEHIVQNAQDATPDEGMIQVNVGEQGDQVYIDIVDNGSGMDEKFLQDHLFRPFYTTKGNAGMGIGAYECREFVQNAGGKVQVTSESGVGTQFRILLPVSHRNDELNMATHV